MFHPSFNTCQLGGHAPVQKAMLAWSSHLPARMLGHSELVANGENTCKAIHAEQDSTFKNLGWVFHLVLFSAHITKLQSTELWFPLQLKMHSDWAGNECRFPGQKTSSIVCLFIISDTLPIMARTGCDWGGKQRPCEVSGSCSGLSCRVLMTPHPWLIVRDTWARSP